MTQGGPGDATDEYLRLLLPADQRERPVGLRERGGDVVLIVADRWLVDRQADRAGAGRADRGAHRRRRRSATNARGGDRRRRRRLMATSSTRQERGSRSRRRARASKNGHARRALAGISDRPLLRLPALLGGHDGVQAEGRGEPAGQDPGAPRTRRLKNFKDVLGIANESEQHLRDGTAPRSRRSRTASSRRAAARCWRSLVGIFAAYGIARFRAGGSQLPFQILQLRMFPPARS